MSTNDRSTKTAHRKPPQSWRVCPACRGRATKIFNISTGFYECQQCDHAYSSPNGRMPAEIEWTLCGGCHQ